MRVALINIQGADDPSLVPRLSKALGREVEVKTFTTEKFGEKITQHVAAFVLESAPSGGHTGDGNMAIASSTISDLHKKHVGKMGSLGLRVAFVSEGFDSARPDSDQTVWLETGLYPIVAAPDAPFGDAFNIFDEDDDPEPELVAPEPVAPAPVVAPVAVQAPPVRRNSGIPIEGGLSDIPLPGQRSAPAVQEQVVEDTPIYRQPREVPVAAPIDVDDEGGIPTSPFRNHPADSMSANEFQRTPRVIPVATGPEIPSYLDEDDAPPIPRRQQPVVNQAPVIQAPAPINVEPPAPAYRAAPPIDAHFDEEPPMPPVRKQEVIEDRPQPSRASSLPSWEDFSNQPVEPEIPVASPAPRIAVNEPKEALPPASWGRQEDEAYDSAPVPVRQQEPAAYEPPARTQQPRYEDEYEAPVPQRHQPEPEPQRPQVRMPDPAPVQRNQPETQQNPPQQSYGRTQQTRPQSPAQPQIDDGYVIEYGDDDDERPTRRKNDSYVPPKRESMADEIDFDDFPTVNHDEDDRLRANREAAELQRASSERQRQERAYVPTPAPESTTFDSMPEAFKAHDPILEEALGGVSEPKSRDHRKLTLLEEAARDFGSGSGKFSPAGQGQAFIIYVTGSRGGAGKTTIAYLLANVLAQACASKGNGEEVYLMEGDYENPKFAQRFGLRRDQNLGELAEFYDNISQSRNLPGNARFGVDEAARAIIDRVVYESEVGGLKILACPYDITSRKAPMIKLAMSKALTQISKSARYIVIDGDTLSNDDVLDRELISKAHHVMIVAWGNDDNDVSDGMRAAHTLKAGVAQGGMGIPLKRTSVFFNRTSYETVEKIKVQIRPQPVTGYIPELTEFQNAWVGSVEPTSNFNRAVTCIAKAANVIDPNDAIIPFANRQFSSAAPGTTGKRRGFRGMFRNKG